MSQPFLKLKDGRTRWLTDFSVPSSLDLGEQEGMIADIRQWLGKMAPDPLASTGPVAGALSDDGNRFWNGKAWVSSVSADGRMRWDGSHWVDTPGP
jgi:hypothetical protein